MSLPNRALSPRKIVIVEADEDFLHLIQMTLGDSGAELLTAGSGQAGLALIRASQPDAIILDLALPDMSGWEVFIQIRDQSAAEPIPPVIILADEGTRLDRTFSLRVAQVHDYQMKPFLPSQLRRSVAEALRVSALCKAQAAGLLRGKRP
jgi:two-component system, OmpR family, response regulator